jgi:hypothetical protein
VNGGLGGAAPDKKLSDTSSIETMSGVSDFAE